MNSYTFGSSYFLLDQKVAKTQGLAPHLLDR